jgi:hypothetical protein
MVCPSSEVRVWKTRQVSIKSSPLHTCACNGYVPHYSTFCTCQVRRFPPMKVRVGVVGLYHFTVILFWFQLEGIRSVD